MPSQLLKIKLLNLLFVEYDRWLHPQFLHESRSTISLEANYKELYNRCLTHQTYDVSLLIFAFTDSVISLEFNGKLKQNFAYTKLHYRWKKPFCWHRAMQRLLEGLPAYTTGGKPVNLSTNQKAQSVSISVILINNSFHISCITY